jgi:hypothetical protein
LRQGELFGLSVDDNDRERIVSMSAVVAKVVRDHLDRFGTTTTISWERFDREVAGLCTTLRLVERQHLQAFLYDLLVWKPALVEVGVVATPAAEPPR